MLIDDREPAETLALDQVDGVIGGAVAADGDDVALHDIADARREIGDEDRGFDAELVEDVVDALIGIAGAGRDGIGIAGQLFEPRIADGGTNGIHVWIAMADNDGLHG